MDILDRKPIVFTGYSKHNFHLKDIISAFVLKNDKVPLNPFMSFGYFLNDLVDRDLVRRANNNMVMIADELWIFGSIADGVLFEINLAMDNNKKIRFFNIDGHGITIEEIFNVEKLSFEQKSEANDDLIKRLNSYLI